MTIKNITANVKSTEKTGDKRSMLPHTLLDKPTSVYICAWLETSFRRKGTRLHNMD